MCPSTAFQDSPWFIFGLPIGGTILALVVAFFLWRPIALMLFPRRVESAGSCIFLGIPLLACVGLSWFTGGAVAFFAPALYQQLTQTYQAQLSQYTADFPVSPTNAPYLTGKAIILQRGTIYARNASGGDTFVYNSPETVSVDDLTCSLPDNVRASSPADVGTVIWLEWYTRVVATYTDNIMAYQISAHVTVIDVKRGLIVGSRSFDGSVPNVPETKYEGEQINGSAPIDDVLAFITTLPRR